LYNIDIIQLIHNGYLIFLAVRLQDLGANKRAGKRANIYSSLTRGMRFHFHGSANMQAFLELDVGGVIIKAGSQAILKSK